MINKNALKGIFVANGDTVASAAERLGMVPGTLYRKLDSGILGSNEIENIIETYHIPKENVCDIFFAQSVTS